MASAIEEWLDIEVKENTGLTDEEIMQSYAPDLWYETKRGNMELDENVFAEAFTEVNHLRYNNGLFYTKTGKATEELLSKDVWESLRDMGVKKDVERTTKKLVGAVKLAATVDRLTVDPNIIPFANGDFYVREWCFHYEEYGSYPYRLSVPLAFELQDTPNFQKWLHDLFMDEDIGVVQEYLGYCLIPTTRAQKALFLVGEGGAGKSVMGVILESILGDALLSTPNSQEFMQDKFKLPELEHRLVLYDDDLSSEALKDTGLYKKLITNTISLSADRKYGQPFKFQPYVKIVSCCNEMLGSIYDNTSGFYRRLLPILVKPVAEDFKPDLRFYDKIRAERRGIVQWALIGLRRLMEQNWVLSESKRSREYLQGKQELGNHFPQFMESVFEFGDGRTPTTEIIKTYKAWCAQNAFTPKGDTTLQKWLGDNAQRYGIKANHNVPAGNGKRVRGYSGLAIKKEWNYTGMIQLV